LLLLFIALDLEVEIVIVIALGTIESLSLLVVITEKSRHYLKDNNDTNIDPASSPRSSSLSSLAYPCVPLHLPWTQRWASQIFV
jgi:hypothetical protein